MSTREVIESINASLADAKKGDVAVRQMAKEYGSAAAAGEEFAKGLEELLVTFVGTSALRLGAARDEMNQAGAAYSAAAERLGAAVEGSDNSDARKAAGSMAAAAQWTDPNYPNTGFLPDIHAQAAARAEKIVGLVKDVMNEAGLYQDECRLGQSRVDGVITFFDDEALEHARAYLQVLSAQPSAQE